MSQEQTPQRQLEVILPQYIQTGEGLRLSDLLSAAFPEDLVSVRFGPVKKIKFKLHGEWTAKDQAGIFASVISARFAKE